MDRIRPKRGLFAGPAALVGVTVIVFSVLFMTGATAHSATATVSTDPQDIAAGQLLYQAHCQSCHGYQGQGGVVKGAPALVDAGAAAADFYLTTGRMPLNAPNDQAVRHRPSFTKDQIRQLDAYVNALPDITNSTTSGPTIPTVAPLCADQTTPTTAPSGCVTLSQGESLFALNCAQCHHAAGSGGMLSKGNVVPSLHNADVTQVAEAMRIGPKPMPVFGTEQMSDQQVSALARYVQYIQHPRNSGGLPIGDFGPVPEGFVGILAGFVVLWFAARMIGARG